MELRETLKSGETKTGTTVNMATAMNVLDATGNILILKGTPVSGTVVESKGAGAFGRAGRLVIGVTSIDLPNGTKIPLRPRTDKMPQRGRSNAVTAIAAGLITGLATTIIITLATLDIFSTDQNRNDGILAVSGGIVTFLIFAGVVRGGNITLDAGRGFEV